MNEQSELAYEFFKTFYRFEYALKKLDFITVKVMQKVFLKK